MQAWDLKLRRSLKNNDIVLFDWEALCGSCIEAWLPIIVFSPFCGPQKQLSAIMVSAWSMKESPPIGQPIERLTACICKWSQVTGGWITCPFETRHVLEFLVGSCLGEWLWSQKSSCHQCLRRASSQQRPWGHPHCQSAQIQSHGTLMWHGPASLLHPQRRTSWMLHQTHDSAFLAELAWIYTHERFVSESWHRYHTFHWECDQGWLWQCWLTMFELSISSTQI